MKFESGINLAIKIPLSKYDAAHSETWLEIRTDSMKEAISHLEKQGIHTCDELGKIPDSSTAIPVWNRLGIS